MSLYSSKEIEKLFNKKFEQRFLIDEINIDSRSKSQNSLFIPLKGNKFDGHAFIRQAFRNGAKVALINKKFLSKFPRAEPYFNYLIPVNDTLKALHTLARYSRERSKLQKMICITGSNGKTTLKEWLSEILEKFYVTYSTQGNFNNHIGLPLTLSRMPQNTKICILEIGTNKPGEIEFLASMSSPDISVITNIGNAHIGNFKNQKSIAIEKSKIFKVLENGVAVIPYQKKFFPILNSTAKKKFSKIFTFGNYERCSARVLEISEISKNTRIHFKLKIFEKIVNFRWNYFSDHFIYNILIILLVCEGLDLKVNQILKHIEKLKPKEGRGSHHEIKFKGKKINIIDDSYNANPESMKLAITGFSKINLNNQRKILVVGDMLELGKKTNYYHESISKLILKSNIDYVITVGEKSKVINDNLSKSLSSKHFKDINKLYLHLSEILMENDFILFKASNSVKLGSVCKKILKDC